MKYKCPDCDSEMQNIKAHYYKCKNNHFWVLQIQKVGGYVSLPENARKEKPKKLFKDEPDSFILDIAKSESWEIGDGLDYEDITTYTDLSGNKRVRGFKSYT